MDTRHLLMDYLEDCKNKPFEWGKHDCFTFTNTAFRKMFGQGWADDWVGRYINNSTTLNRNELKKEFGFSDFTDAVDARLKRISYAPPLGALVTTKQCRKWLIGVAMGISTGKKAVFLDKEGILYLPFDDIHQAWIKAK